MTKKSHLKLHDWNTISLIFTDSEYILCINHTIRMRIDRPTSDLKSLLNSKITLGGHSNTLKSEFHSSKHLFQGLIKKIKLILNDNKEFKATFDK